jgi:hypothetical protein
LMGRAVIGLGGRQEWLDGRSNRAGIKVCAMRPFSRGTDLLTLASSTLVELVELALATGVLRY